MIKSKTMVPSGAKSGASIIGLEDFAKVAATLPQLPCCEFEVDQFVFALGGISSLYLLQAAKQGTDHLEVQTLGGFASDLVPREHILQVIHDCAGVSRKRSKPLLMALESTLDRYAEKYVGRQFQLGFFGSFRRIEGSRYELNFRDPDSRLTDPE